MKGKNIVLGVSGGIAVYKAVELARALVKAGAKVHTIMTENATRFVTPLTFREITENPVVTCMWSEVTQWHVQHIALASLADLFIVAPATANIIGKVANGIADDMLTTTVMATKAPVLIVPAMNTNMYENSIVSQNIAKLCQYGYNFIEPEEGELACKVIGKGKFPKLETILFHVERSFKQKSKIVGKKVLVTAGGTKEAIDPVRYIGNCSSGRMGYAIAREAALRGAEVTLVSSTENISTPPEVTLIKVESAREMKEVVDRYFDEVDIVIKAAAVADYRPKIMAEQKIKKDNISLSIELDKNPDILFELGKRKKNQILVGFAAETNNLLEYGFEKLNKKNLDMLVANDVTQEGAGFAGTTNIATLLYPSGVTESLKIMSKAELADIILERVAEIK